jgi:ribosomal protein S18 acetylase RimI-like enzyme
MLIACERMTSATRTDARTLIGAFLGDDAYYRHSAGAYGDGGAEALDRALELFLMRPEIGFVWLAYANEAAARVPVGACVVCYAISTSRGAIVAKLDDVNIAAGWQARGVGTAMLQSLAAALRQEGVARIDSGCHRDNRDAWRFYERLGFRTLGEERIALLLESLATKSDENR